MTSLPSSPPPTIPFLLVVFIASTLFHLHARLTQIPRPLPAKYDTLGAQPTVPQNTPGAHPTVPQNTLGAHSISTVARRDPGAWTVNTIGRLGNQMGEYATLYALAKMNGRAAYISPEMHRTLSRLFRITLPILSASETRRIPWRNIPLHDWMSDDYRTISSPFVRLTGYPCSWTFYHHLRAEIAREFSLHDHVREEAQTFLRRVGRERAGEGRNLTFIGVHVRRGDYVHVMPQVWKGVVADRGYLEKALGYFRDRYPNPLFVVTSNGMAWCRENINASRGDVIFAGDGAEGSPGRDFALLTQCNHTVMTIGTFGIWAGYLAGGETVYLANYTLPDSPFLKIFKPEAAFLPEWVGIPADLSPLLHG